MKHIVVIDDSPTIRTSVEYAIRGLGHSVTHAENGIDALDKVKGIKDKGDDVALCLVDINMPEMDGITFIKEFRKIDRFTPLLVLTTESGGGKIAEGKQAGASGWVVKPFQPDALLNAVNSLIR